MKNIEKIVWSGRTVSPGVVENRVPEMNRQSLPNDKTTASSSAEESSRTAHRTETEVTPKPTLEGLENQTINKNPATMNAAGEPEVLDPNARSDGRIVKVAPACRACR